MLKMNMLKNVTKFFFRFIRTFRQTIPVAQEKIGIITNYYANLRAVTQK